MNQFYLSLILFLCLPAFAFSQEKGVFTDSRDNRSYKTVKIGNQVWMAENLAFKPNSGSWVYEDNVENESIYGRLYNWDSAKIVCPTGWHLPSVTEWDIITNILDGQKKAGIRLKAKTDLWNSYDYAQINPSGFDALPGGYADQVFAKFLNIGEYSYFRTSTELDKQDSWVQYIHYSFNGVSKNFYSNNNGYSIRCVKDKNIKK